MRLDATYSLRQRTTLSDSNLITFLDTESRADVRGQVGVAFLITGVFGDEVEVLAADDQSTVHFGGDNGASKDSAANADQTGERAFLVCRKRKAALADATKYLYQLLLLFSKEIAIPWLAVRRIYQYMCPQWQFVVS